MGKNTQEYFYSTCNLSATCYRADTYMSILNLLIDIQLQVNASMFNKINFDESQHF